jgi:hypothetical protein
VQTGVVGGFAVKIGITILTLVIIPILKSLPALIFGLFARDWWAQRKARKKPPRRVPLKYCPHIAPPANAACTSAAPSPRDNP